MRRMIVDSILGGGLQHSRLNFWRWRAIVALSFGLSTVAIVMLLNYDQQQIEIRLQEHAPAAVLELSKLSTKDSRRLDGLSLLNGGRESIRMVIAPPSKYSLSRSSVGTSPVRRYVVHRPSRLPQMPKLTTLASPSLVVAATSSTLPSATVCRNRSSEITPSELDYLSNLFAPVTAQFEKDVLLGLLHSLDSALRASGVRYVVYGGTLLGAWRHRGFVPWDDDVDVLASFRDAERVQSSLGSLTDHRLHVDTWWRYKFYHVNRSTPIEGRSWRWPFIDVCFYGVNGTHLYDVDPELRDAWAWPPHVVLPAARMKFEDLVVPVPRDIATFIATNYNLTMCETRVWSHRDEVYAPGDKYVTVPCWKLHGLFIFYCYEDNGDRRRGGSSDG